MPASRPPIPFVVIGGFLGAGKTTAVNALLASLTGHRIVVLVNDFGGLAIDAALIAQRNATTISLTNGCVCCSLVSGLVQAVIDALALDPAPDCIVVEASGVSDPRRIAQIARADPALAPDATIVLVAADQWLGLSADRYVGDVVKAQVASADFLVLNKVDLVDPSQLEALRLQLHQLAPRARQLDAVGARLPYGDLLGHALDDALNVVAPTLAKALPGAGDVQLPSAASDANVPPRAGDAHARQFATRILRSSQPVCAALLRQALDRLPPSVLRAKGFVRLDESPGAWQLVQVVGSRWTLVETSPRVVHGAAGPAIEASAATLADSELAVKEAAAMLANCELPVKGAAATLADSELVVIGAAATLADADLAGLAAAFGPVTAASERPVSRPARAARVR